VVYKLYDYLNCYLKEVDKMRCRRYVGVACADGSCPIANEDEYEERSISIIRNCEDCYLYKGCEDCALYGTEYCSKDNWEYDKKMEGRE